MKIPRITLAAYAIAALVVALDQASKAWMLTGLSLREVGRVFVAPPILNFTYVENTGASFHLFGGGAGRWLLSLFSLIVAAVLARWATRVERRTLIAGIGLIIGGAVGNAVDRIRLGYVVDFIDMAGTTVFPWVFNIADSAITVGVVLLVIDNLMTRPRQTVGAASLS